ncbi:hypothetical protein J2TS4_34410 [Paenibacillus sp. J2TS4]|nr:hypothetical protein J2TS4_34410 [Paenibacillus sp. J2TS4]
MFPTPREKFYDRIFDYVSKDKRTALTLGTLFILLVILIVLLLQLSKKEDPTYTTYNNYSCEEMIGSEQLSTDTTLNILKAARIESELNFWNIFKDKLFSYNSVFNLVNESSKLLVLAEQSDSDNQAKTITIPKDACYLSINSHPNEFLISNLQFPSTKIEIYRWTKKYRTYLSDKEHTEHHTILIMNNHSIHIKQFFSQSFLFPIMKNQIMVYNLDSKI